MKAHGTWSYNLPSLVTAHRVNDVRLMLTCLFKDHPHEAPKQETQKSRCCAQQCQHLEGAPSGHCGLSADDRSITNDAVPRWWKLLRAEHLGTKRPEINGEGDQWR